MSLYKEGDPAERARTMPLPPEGVNPETFRVALEAYQELQKESEGELSTRPPHTSCETKGSTAKERYLQRMTDQTPPGKNAEAEKGEVLLRELISKPRPTDNITGKEIIIQSSKKPITIKPLLGVTPAGLHKHRSDTHTRIAHSTSNVVAHATGVLDGLVDGLVNGAAELLEDGVFFVSKTYHGARHGWSRGKFQGGQN